MYKHEILTEEGERSKKINLNSETYFEAKSENILSVMYPYLIMMRQNKNKPYPAA